VQFEIRVLGVEACKARLQAYNSENILTRIDFSVADFAENAADTLRNTPYPPELPKQKYRRTGNFGKAWKAEKLSKARWKVVNAVTDRRGRTYPGYVAGRAPDDQTTQAWMHSGRWWLARDVVDQLENDLNDAIVKAIEAI
jgi:hypothetical protein